MATHSINLKVNGVERRMRVRANVLLAELLREDLRLTGVHVGCDTSQCGCCTVHVDGEAVKSCTMLALQAVGREVTTIEGLAPDGGPLHPVQQAMTNCHGLQCGFCTPGVVMTMADFLSKEPDADETAIRRALEGNLCRCTGYQHIVDAALSVAAGTARAAATEEQRDV